MDRSLLLELGRSISFAVVVKAGGISVEVQLAVCTVIRKYMCLEPAVILKITRAAE
jgi:hypothetical protein